MYSRSWRTRRMTAPPDLRDFDEKIADVRRDKASAIDSQDFEKAAALRDTEKQLIEKTDAREKESKVGDMDAAAEVNEELIARSWRLGCAQSHARSRGHVRGRESPRVRPGLGPDGGQLEVPHPRSSCRPDVVDPGQ
jgi:UvrB/uvrC motif